MLILKKSYLTILVIFVSLFIGCAKDNHLKRLKKLEPVKEIVPEKDKVTVGAKALTKKESSALFGTSLKNYQPIQLTIINNTQQCYTFNPQLIDLPLVDIKKVNKAISKSIKIKKLIPILLAVGIGIPLVGVMAFGFFFGIVSCAFYSLPNIILASSIACGALGSEILLVCETTLACKKIDAVADQTEKKVRKKSLSHKKNLIINPEEEVNMFFFTEKKDLKNNFSLQLTNEHCLDNLELNVTL